MADIEKEDAEIEAMRVAIHHLERSDERTRERFIYYLVHRFFPEGRFEPTRVTRITDLRDRQE